MRRNLSKVFLVALSTALLVACGANEGSVSKKEPAFRPDITIEEIDWSVGAGTVEGENYVLLEYTNNSKYDISSFKVDFVEADKVDKEEKEAFYKDIQISQGFDDEWMREFVESREELKQPITMYASHDEPVLAGESIDKVKCYYIGGLTSKNVVYPDIVKPEKVTIKYEKDGVMQVIYYNFESEMYDVEIETEE